MASAAALVVLLSLLGGYYFFSASNLFRFRAQQVVGQKLLFMSALFGIPFLVLGRLSCWGVAHFLPTTYRVWHSAFPIPGLGTALAATLLAVAATHVLNWKLDRNTCLAYSIRRYGSELEQLFLQVYLEEDLLLLTLDTDKVYVGQIAATTIPERPMAYLELLTMASGYRRSDTHEIEFQFDYSEAYPTPGRKGQDDDDEMGEDDAQSKYRLLLPIERIVTASFFDPNFHQRVQVTRSSSKDASSSSRILIDLLRVGANKLMSRWSRQREL